MTDEDRKTVWDLLEEHDASVDETAALYSWSLNYDAGKGPFSLFLDLIGWSEDQLGEPLYSLKDASLGYLELDYLGKALREYAADPHGVYAFAEQLLEAEGE